ncbi:La-related protein like [Actinidia chinensis var. chinensis]|uniref:La-related protein like n=1 Tax=Actinidia chinensis var. chinensis TaxID=1590841 RepID=A0A2R6S0G6_ACTCC|nr:La-related protein like [Actinidia chinensis var. chinensis]
MAQDDSSISPKTLDSPPSLSDSTAVAAAATATTTTDHEINNHNNEIAQEDSSNSLSETLDSSPSLSETTTTTTTDHKFNQNDKMAQGDASKSLPETLDSPLSLSEPTTTTDHHPSSSSSAASTSSPSSPSSSSDPSLTRTASLSRLNARAPEFVPRSSSASSMPRTDVAHHSGLIHMYPRPNSAFQVAVHPVQQHHPRPVHYRPHHPHPHHRPQYYAVGFVDHQEVAVQSAPVESDHVPVLKNGLTEEAASKILNQVEYYFSDLNLATTDHLMRFINKDAEGYVPMSVVASFKKIKAAITSNSQLASILRDSYKLVVSEDGKKVRRQHPLTESDMEELQSRIVVAENLPEDHCYQNLMKIFSSVGSVNSIRTCQPQTSNGGASSASRSGKADSMLFSNKLHAFVEYESVELAEKAVAELNDEANWRSGLKVRLLVRCTVKSALARGKRVDHETNANFEEDEPFVSEQLQPNDKHLEDHSKQFDAQSHEYPGEEHVYDKEGGLKKARGRGRGKLRGRGQYHYNNRGSHIGTPPSGNAMHSEPQPSIGKQPPGPRMPDGTRGFSIGRGKPITINIS